MPVERARKTLRPDARRKWLPAARDGKCRRVACIAADSGVDRAGVRDDGRGFFHDWPNAARYKNFERVKIRVAFVCGFKGQFLLVAVPRFVQHHELEQNVAQFIAIILRQFLNPFTPEKSRIKPLSENSPGGRIKFTRSFNASFGAIEYASSLLTGIMPTNPFHSKSAYISGV